jgi:ABC-2 type transport system ATP-binding protein
MIRLVALRKEYGTCVAVDDLDLTVEPGEIFAFLGPNGAGKTTTIRMMIGLLEPTGGTVELGGHDIAREPEAAKALTGYVPDQPALYDKLTGMEFLRFVGGLYGLARDGIEDRAADLLDEFAMTERAHELIETYSHGMKQRLTLAAALIHRPRILILDEPMVGIDPQGALELRQILTGLAAAGVTIFLSTHSLGVAEELADRIGILDDGRLVALGTLDELQSRAALRPETAPLDASLESVFLRLTGTEDRRG